MYILCTDIESELFRRARDVQSAMPGSSRRFFKFWEVWVWGLSRVEEMQVEREEAGLGRWRRWRRWRLRTCAARPPPAISVLQYYFGPPPATPCLKYSSTQAFNKFSRSKIAGGPKNSHWFARLVLGLPRQTGWCCWSPWWWRPGGGGGRGEGVHTGEQLGKLGLHQGCVASCYSWGLSAAWSHLARLDLTTCCRQAPCQRCRLGSPGEELVLPPPFQLANLWPCHLLANKPTTPKVDSLYFEHFPLWATLGKTDNLNIFHLTFDLMFLDSGTYDPNVWCWKLLAIWSQAGFCQVLLKRDWHCSWLFQTRHDDVCTNGDQQKYIKSTIKVCLLVNILCQNFASVC